MKKEKTNKIKNTIINFVLFFVSNIRIKKKSKLALVFLKKLTYKLALINLKITFNKILLIYYNKNVKNINTS